MKEFWHENCYSIMFTLGIALSFTIFELFFRKHLKEKNSKIYYLEVSLLIAIIAGTIGAYLFQNIYNLIENPSEYKWTWSLTFYGGVISGAAGFLITYYVWAKKYYPEGLSKLVLIAPASIACGHALGRFGCFFAGCCYGLETDAWYGVKFETTSSKVIPTNLFEAIFLVILGVILLLLAFKKESKFCFPIYLISYGIWRFLVEFIRGDHRGSFIPGISPSQFWSILLVIGGIIYAILVAKIAKIFTKK